MEASAARFPLGRLGRDHRLAGRGRKRQRLMRRGAQRGAPSGDTWRTSGWRRGPPADQASARRRPPPLPVPLMTAAPRAGASNPRLRMHQTLSRWHVSPGWTGSRLTRAQAVGAGPAFAAAVWCFMSSPLLRHTWLLSFTATGQSRSVPVCNLVCSSPASCGWWTTSAVCRAFVGCSAGEGRCRPP